MLVLKAQEDTRRAAQLLRCSAFRRSALQSLHARTESQNRQILCERAHTNSLALSLSIPLSFSVALCERESAVAANESEPERRGSALALLLTAA